MLLLSVGSLVMAHEGHESVQEHAWTQWIGSFHLIFLHFPIALINMLALSECLLVALKRPIFEYSSRFLAVSAAILSPVTAIFGLIYSDAASYEGLMETLLWWHMWLGIFTAVFAFALPFIRERMGLGKLYYCSLFLLFLLVNLAGYFGGGMTFGPYYMSPPI